MASIDDIYKKIQAEKKKKEEEQRILEQQRFDQIEKQRLWMLRDKLMHERLASTTAPAAAAASSSSAGGGSGNKPKPTPPTPTLQPFIIQLSVGSSEEISIPMLDGFSYDFVVNWGDSTPTTYISSWDDSGNTHTYADAGIYNLTINGICEAFSVFCNNNLSDNIINIISWGNTGLKQLDFQSCTELLTIPTDTYHGFSGMTSFWGTFFNCTSLITIPAGLFDYAINVTDFGYTFNNCLSLISIPSGLFNNNTLVTNFDSTFRHCELITSIPNGLFNNCPNVTYFYSTFQFCTELTSIPSGLFNNCPNVTNFEYTFEHCISLTGLVPTLWISYPTTDGYNCFNDDVSVTNFLSIPVPWGGV